MLSPPGVYLAAFCQNTAILFSISILRFSFSRPRLFSICFCQYNLSSPGGLFLYPVDSEILFTVRFTTCIWLGYARMWGNRLFVFMWCMCECEYKVCNACCMCYKFPQQFEELTFCQCKNSSSPVCTSTDHRHQCLLLTFDSFKSRSDNWWNEKSLL